MVVSTAQSMFYNLEKIKYFSNTSLVNLHSNLTNERKIYYIVNLTTTPPTPETAHLYSLPC